MNFTRATSLLPVVLMVGAVVGVAACYGPTEVRVEVTRDVACAPYGATSTAIVVRE